MDEIISWLSLKLDAIIQAVIDFFIWLLDLLKDIVLFCFDGVLSAIVAVVSAIPSPAFLANGLNSVVAQFSPQLAYYLNFSGLSQGLLIIAAGYLFYLLRKFSTLFQW